MALYGIVLCGFFSNVLAGGDLWREWMKRKRKGRRRRKRGRCWFENACSDVCFPFGMLISRKGESLVYLMDWSSALLL